MAGQIANHSFDVRLRLFKRFTFDSDFLGLEISLKSQSNVPKNEQYSNNSNKNTRTNQNISKHTFLLFVVMNHINVLIAIDIKKYSHGRERKD